MSSQPNAGVNITSSDEVRAICGNLDDEKVIDILNLQPTAAELEQAVLWTAGDGDLLARSGRPLTGKVAEIVEILADEDDEPPPMR
jgi:hypothetical protein